MLPLLLLSPPAIAQSPVEATAPSVVAARRYLGRPYGWGGRGSELDCMGLVFRAWSDATGKAWRDLSVNPTALVSKRQLGPPVPGLDGVLTAAIPWEQLRSGDVIFFLGPTENVNEPALVTVDQTPLWVWHMGIYAGGPERTFVVGDHYAGQVAELSLPTYLAEHASVYVGLYAVRPGG